MNQDQLLTIARSLLKFGSGILIAKGIGDSSVWEMVISGILAAVGMYFSWRNSKSKQVLKDAVAGDIALNSPAVLKLVPDPAPVETKP